MYKIYDVSMSIFEGMTVYKNKAEKQPRFERSTNNYVSETKIQLDVHCGTHVDAPLHMVPEGETIESIALENLVGPCRVLDFTDVTGAISREHLEQHQPRQDEFILLKTSNSYQEAFNPDFIYLAEDGAHYLADQKVSGVGIDSLGVERSQPGHPTHKTLFQHEIIIIEGLRLKDVPEGRYFMVATPLKLIGTDASPARVILIEGTLPLDK
ncbi:cyclase [Ammoniphilus oxalaticus]|uniref:Kynurenine formamidase n=1 Tax=Ammoniphilus oxalaticus TaxID=66863 RepID=A0A419SK26_9BACL|nr:cyclase family protein [Ammoniphilus oxalaticus]RKD24325.1 cyclase [Ammoniphilus oxalaticus]